MVNLGPESRNRVSCVQAGGPKKFPVEAGSGGGFGLSRIRRVLSGELSGPPQGRASAQADLAQDALAGEQFGGEADHETEHGQAAIPGLSEGNKTEAGGGGVSHLEFVGYET